MMSTLLGMVEAEKAAGLLGLNKLIENYGIERVAQWMKNLLVKHGYQVTIEPPPPPSPGLISDPRR